MYVWYYFMRCAVYIFLITFYVFNRNVRAHTNSAAVACTDTAALYSVTHPITNHP
jgi:hypothetical protein